MEKLREPHGCQNSRQNAPIQEVTWLVILEKIEGTNHGNFTKNRTKSESISREVECELVDVDRIKELCPLIRTDDLQVGEKYLKKYDIIYQANILQGGLWIPGDGVANPFEICLALSVLAHRQGAKIVQNCRLEEVVINKVTSAVAGVRTSLGWWVSTID